ncbi:hypothetical protein [Actinoplanes awajinensis]|uniref:Uncharacterized protein n=1 Tax=Actinoplanes awajinensis subsp. mycoplanecinus TaxID=135947 RepID=A0A117MR79_9ACTN|nr:hypothetical protein [Actinoplanes awajinensis]KUL31417.1 hypothetical protein ADL15_22025 [Actinoplanes awajinensis subsp. mycoplanecinus]
MLSSIHIQAIARCLIDLDAHAQRTQGGPGENLLAVLQETPVPGHPDPSARHLGVNPLPVQPQVWRHPDGPVAALRQAHDDMRRFGVQEQLAQVTGVRFLAWVYLYTQTIDDEDGPATVRQIDAVDIDGRAHLLTHVLGEAGHCLLVLPDTAAPDFDGTLTVLNTLARTMRTSG